MSKKLAKNFLKYVSLFCAIGFATSSSSFADTLVSWDIPTSAAPNSTTSPTSVNSSANDASVLPSTITMGPGIIGSINNSSTGWGAKSWGSSTNQSLDFCNSNNDWFYFSVSAKPGKTVTISGVGVLTMYASGSGPGNWALLSSTNSSFATTNTPVPPFITNSIFASGAQRGPTTATPPGVTYALSVASTFSDSLSTSNIVIQSGKTVYFRLVGYNGFDTAGTGRIIGNSTDNVDFTILGSVADAPIQTFTWDGGSSGLWNYTDTNWLDGSGASSAFLADNNATFSIGATASITNTGVSVGFLSNNVPSGQSTTLRGGILNAASIINVAGGNLLIESTNSATTLVNSGLGTLSLAAPGTYTTVNLTAGKIETLADGVFSGAVNASGDSILDVGTFSNTIGALTVNESSIVGTGILKGAGFGFALDQNDRTVAVSMQGTGGLSKTGSKTLTLSGSNSFSGDITLSGGTLATSGADRLPDTATVVMSANTILSLGGNETIKSLYASSANASAQVNLQSYILTMNVTASNQFVGSLVGTGSLVKNGSSILTLTNTGTYSGGTTMNAGSFRLQASGNKTINVDDNTVTLTTSPFGVGALNWAGGAIYSSSLNSRSIYNSVNLLGGTVTLGDSNSTTGTGDMIVSADVTGVSTTLNANCTVNAVAAVDWEQPILGSGFNLSKGGTNKLTLRSTNALGTLSVLAGILDARGSNSIGQVNVAGGAALAYAGTSTPFGAATINLSNGAIFGQSASIGTTLSDRTLLNPINVLGNVLFGIGAVTGSGGFASHLSGNVDLGGANRTLTIANATYLYGAVANGGMNVTRTNTDLLSTKTLGLYGANSYSGGTTVNGSVDYVNNPILQLGNDSALGSGDLTLAGGGSLIVKAVSKADDIYNANRIINNGISIASGVSGVFDAGTNSVTSLDGLQSGIVVTNNLTLRGIISGQGSLVKTNSGSLTLTGTLSYEGATTVTDGNLIVVKTNLTTTISSNTVFIAMSNNVVAGTYPVLPGELTEIYPAATFSGPTGATATFNETTGSVTVTTVGPVTDGYSLYLSSNGLPADTAFDSKVNGVTVGLKYAFGSANGMPQNNGVTALPVVGGNQLTTYTFDVKDDSALTVTYQTSSDLVTWTTAQLVSTSTGTGSSPTGFVKKQVQATGSGKLFIRINVTR